MPYNPRPSTEWASLSDHERFDKITYIICGPGSQWNVVAVREVSHVILEESCHPKNPMSIAKRGNCLMDIERILRNHLDQSIEVFLEPQGDMNKLRVKLRGVKV
jgi:hypothetical protein|tara:strand:- start:1072 stop:1383 length:312 start_codon:yes stop_codon:yes gene_type:complete